MRVLCRHGHFAFYPRKSSDIGRFSETYGLDLERQDDFYTFPKLVDAPKYSLTGKPYINLPALSTFEGDPWDVMAENDFVYHIGFETIVPKLTIVSIIELTPVGLYFMFDGTLIQPGSRTLTGQQILSYSGEIFEDKIQLRVLEFSYD